MGSITSNAAQIYRDYVTDGVPSSGDNEPDKAEIRALCAQIEEAVGRALLGSVTVFKDTKAHLDADLAHAADTTALVYADATAANNDIYVKVGGTGTGSWTKTTIVHDAIAAVGAEILQAYVDDCQAAQAAAEDARDEAIAAAAGLPVVHAVDGAPTDDLGNDGDWAVSKERKAFHGPKTDGAWPDDYLQFAALVSPTALPRPDDALGAWYADKLVTTASGARVVPNALSDVDVPDNLVIAPYRCFGSTGNQGLGLTANVTVTDRYAAGSDGTASRASRVQITSGGGGIAQQGGATWVSDTYTLSLRMKSVSGSTTIYMGKAGSTVDKTITGSWAEYSTSFTLSGSDQFYICGSASAAEFLIEDYRLTKNGVALSATELAGHLFLGDHPLDAGITAAGGLLSVPDGSQGAVSLFNDATTTHTAVTCVAVCQITDTAEFKILIRDLVDINNFGIEPVRQPSSTQSYPEGFWGGANSQLSSYDFVDPYAMGGVYVFGFRYDGSNASLFINNVKVRTVAHASSARVLASFQMFLNCGGLKYGGHALWPVALSDDDMIQAAAHFTDRKGVVDPLDQVVVFNGDSITQENAAPSSWTQELNPFVNGAGASTISRNIAIAGTRLNSMITQAAANADPLIEYANDNQRFVYVMGPLHNDIAFNFPDHAGSYSNWIAAFLAHCQAMKNAGWYVMVCTILPSSAVGFDAIRNTANAALRAAVGTQIDAVIDIATDTDWGVDGAGSNATYYPDGTHPAQVVHTDIRENYVGPALAALAA